MSYIPHDVELAEALQDVIGQLRRRSRNGLGEPFEVPGLTPAQVELLRHLRRHPGSSVKEAASTLGLAPNTISTIVGELIRVGLLERQRDELDRRVARLRLTPPASNRIAAWLQQRDLLTVQALSRISSTDKETIRGALPALRALSDAWSGDPPA